MYADVEIATGTEDPVDYRVQHDAVIDGGDRSRSCLHRSSGDGRFEPRNVKLVGVRGSGGRVEIKEGLAEARRQSGDVSANFLIDAESNLKAALEGLSAANPGSEQGEIAMIAGLIDWSARNTDAGA